MDSINTPANDSITDRLYSLNNGQLNFDDLYDNNRSFRTFLGILREEVLENGGGPFSGVVTPESSPGRGGNGGRNGEGGGGGNAGAEGIVAG